MGDQRIEARAAFGLEHPGYGDGVGGVGGQAIDGLGREGDQQTRRQGLRGRLDRGGVYFAFRAEMAMVTTTASGTTSVFFHSSCPTPKASRLRLTRAFIFA